MGNWLLGWIVDRRGFRPVLAPTFFIAAASIASISQVYGSLTLAFIAIAVAGFCLLGGQSALNALAATFYPTSVRSTGMGWALGIGRLGANVGPVVGGELMHLNWSTGDLLVAAAIPPAIAVLMSFAFWHWVKLPERADRVEQDPERLRVATARPASDS